MPSEPVLSVFGCRFFATFSFTSLLVAALPALPHAPAAGGVIVTGLLLWFLAQRFYFPISVVPLAAIIAFSLALWQCHQLAARQLSPDMDGHEFYIGGFASGLIDTNSSSWGDGTMTRFDFFVDKLARVPAQQKDGTDQPCQSPEASGLSGKVALTWFDMPVELQPLGALQDAGYLCLKVRLKRPRGLANPGGFDYQRSLLSAGFVATGMVRSSYPSPASGAMGMSVRLDRWFSHQRQTVRSRLISQYPESPVTAPFLALAIGDKRFLSERQWQQLRASGTLHLLVVSGLHISLIAAVGFLVGDRISRLLALRGQRYCVVLPLLCSTGLAFIYAALAGFALPTQRALIMVLVANVFVATGHYRRPWFAFWLAMALVLLVDPLAGWSIGFWLSFAVVALILLTLAQAQKLSRWLQMARLQGRIFVGMLVPIALFTASLSLWAPLVNLIAIPWVSFVVVPLVLLATLGVLVVQLDWLNTIALPAAFAALEAFWSALDWVLGENPSSKLMPIAIDSVPPWFWPVAVCAGGAIMLPMVPRAIKLALLVALVLVAIKPKPTSENLSLTVLDVGQGLSIVARAGDHALVYDTGPRLGAQMLVATDILLPSLQRAGVANIDLLVISHGDGDHASGVAQLTTSLPAAISVSGEPDRLPVASEPCYRSQAWNLGELQVSVLWPESPKRLDIANDNSCVLLLRWRGRQVLLTGDISQAAEWRLAELVVGPIDVLVAPHHGSKSSSSHRLLLATEPAQVVFSTGFGNGYGHPASVVQARYQALTNAALWNTAVDGAIVFQWDERSELEVSPERQVRPRFWY